MAYGFAVPDQKAVRKIVPLFGVPDALLFDRGTNLLLHLKRDVCDLLGVNTTAYHHPQCDGIVERFNRTLKAMLHKHAARFGNHETDTSQESYGLTEIPHTVLLGKSHLSFCFVLIIDLLPTSTSTPTDATDY